ncbi:hypothetical protein [Bradyrhizobium sp. Tv2a-2]|uniref:hypothetical protein n=1 Tax=Bradyrhizobium sp. Tv2a-2 TaxID=113395 RepID=UPI0004647DE5|nr:hypothetical protein [Bradyrhizobium sp. Tv2a-2]
MTNIDIEIEELFRALPKGRGSRCKNPITGGHFLRGEGGKDAISYQKREARKALMAREWFASNGPPDAPPLPLAPNDWEEMRGSTGLVTLVGFYARSLSFRDWNTHLHPSFEEFARGLMSVPDTGLWDLQRRVGPSLLTRYPSHPLPGMAPGLYWVPPKEYEEIMEEGRRARQWSISATHATDIDLVQSRR